MNLVKSSKKLGVTAVALATIGAGVAFGETSASAATNYGTPNYSKLVDYGYANAGAETLVNDTPENLKEAMNDTIEDFNSTSDPQMQSKYMSQYYGTYKALYGHFPNEASQNQSTQSSATNVNANSNAQAQGSTSQSQVVNNQSQRSNSNSQATVQSTNTKGTGVNTSDVTKGTELPQTGNNSGIVMSLFGSLLAMFGFGLATKKNN